MKTIKYNEETIELDYSPFFKKAKEIGLNTYQLKLEHDVSAATLSRMKNNRNMTLDTAGRLMKIIGTNDLNEFVKIKFRKR